MLTQTNANSVEYLVRRAAAKAGVTGSGISAEYIQNLYLTVGYATQAEADFQLGMLEVRGILHREAGQYVLASHPL